MISYFSSGREFALCVERAPPGSVIVYHTGELAKDCTRSLCAKDVSNMARRLSNMSLARSADDQSIDYGMGVGTLAQRRVSDGPGLDYLFIKNRQRAPRY